VKLSMKYALVPLGAFAAFFVIPKIFQFLINSHSDTGIVIVVALVCALASLGIYVFNKITSKENSENER